MWFSYPREESWVPLTIAKVKEIQQQNREGIIPADLGELMEDKTQVAKVLDYENVVGQDSLTRLDERNRNNANKKKKNNRDKNRPQNQDRDRTASAPRPPQTPANGDQTPPVRTGSNPEGQSGQNNRNNRRFRPNRNNQNRNNPNNRGNESAS